MISPDHWVLDKFSTYGSLLHIWNLHRLYFLASLVFHLFWESYSGNLISTKVPTFSFSLLSFSQYLTLSLSPKFKNIFMFSGLFLFLCGLSLPFVWNGTKDIHPFSIYVPILINPGLCLLQWVSAMDMINDKTDFISLAFTLTLERWLTNQPGDSFLQLPRNLKMIKEIVKLPSTWSISWPWPFP